jgi:hypothetical protein
MKKTAILMMALAALCATGCKEKKQRDDIITTMSDQQAPKPQAPIRMQDYTGNNEVDWVGRKYTVEIHRAPSDSLPKVKDENGQQFVDNAISLRIIRADGSVFFSKTFTKQSFSAHIPEDYRNRGILEGLVFDKVDGNKLEFAASVCYPQTDEYIPLEVEIDNFGNISIERDNHLDTYGDEEEDENSL